MSCRSWASTIATAAVVAWLALPASAGATTYCVIHTGTCPAGQTAEPSLQTALTAAAADLPGPNTVDIGPGLYDAAGPGFDYDTTGAPPVAISGAGQDQTTIDASGAAAFVLRVGIAGSSVSDLTIAMHPSVAAGLVLAADDTRADRVTVTGTGSLSGADGVTLDGAATFAGGTVTMPDSSHAAVNQATGATGTVSSSHLSAPIGLATAATGHPQLAAHDVTISATQNAVAAGTGSTVTVDDALMLMHDNAPAALASSNATLTVHAATIVALDGAGSSIGGAVTASDHSTSSLTLEDSILHGFHFSFSRSAGTGAAASVTAQYDDLHITNPGGGSVGGTVTLDHNIDADPQFVNASAGDYHLLAHSPAIDAGGPCDAVCSTTPDLAGAQAPIDGDGDGIKSRDLGAYEYTHRAPFPQPTVGGAVTVGTPVPFDGSASTDPDDGDRLSFAWFFDDGATAGGAHVTHAFSTPGLHSAALTVTDSSGLSATGVTYIQILAVPVPPTPSAPPHHTLPVVSGLAFTPSTFAVSARATVVSARSRPHHAASPVGSSIHLRLSETATLSIAIARLVSGHESHGHCLTSARHGHTCTVAEAVATLKRTAVRGGNATIAFSGRIGSRPLAPGSYQATVTATDSLGVKSAPVRAKFTVVAA